MKNWMRYLALGLCLAILMCCAAGCASKQKSLLDPKNPTTVTVWNYYNGDQLAAFEKLVNTFNDTIGAEKGIVVVSVSQGSIDNLATCLLDSVNGKAGADNVPSLAAIYAETVYILDQKQAVVPLDGYFTKEELAEYVPSFLEEGRLKEGGELVLFPVSKSTEVFIVNSTDWAPFAAATGTEISDITSWEALTAAAEAYYNWSDSLTPDVPEDGRALFGRDSLANYIFIGTRQLGHEMFKIDKDGKLSIDLDRDSFKKLWDNYYIPFINGYFAAYASYRSEDIKTGAVLAMIGSSSGISYIPTVVTDAEDVSHDIEISIGEGLSFEGAEQVSVQQGAGYCVMKTSEAEQYAATEFLKWFTDTDQNLSFSIMSGYSPVKLAANKADAIKAAFTTDSQKSANALNALLVSAEVYNSGKVYACRGFEGSKDVRDLLADALTNVCTADRAAVLAQIAEGKTREEAVQPYITDAYFDAWFDALSANVMATVG